GTARKVAASFDYIFHFVQLKNKSQKRLKGIYELGINRKEEKISIRQICRYDHKSDNWQWEYIAGEDKIAIGEEENHEVTIGSRLYLSFGCSCQRGGKVSILHYPSIVFLIELMKWHWMNVLINVGQFDCL
ncbi:MAG TPA: hypothetical protein PLQ29_10165, partial [Spirochaetales bacterium]|nr:hypothetical protein [Spirochaetales bacterium]